MSRNISLKVELPASKNGSNWEEDGKSAGQREQQKMWCHNRITQKPHWSNKHVHLLTLCFDEDDGDCTISISVSCNGSLISIRTGVLTPADAFPLCEPARSTYHNGAVPVGVCWTEGSFCRVRTLVLTFAWTSPRGDCWRGDCSLLLSLYKFLSELFTPLVSFKTVHQKIQIFCADIRHL